jgi:hypothetical protein
VRPRARIPIAQSALMPAMLPDTPTTRLATSSDQWPLSTTMPSARATSRNSPLYASTPHTANAVTATRHSMVRRCQRASFTRRSATAAGSITGDCTET